MVVCAAVGCPNRSDRRGLPENPSDISFHGFPLRNKALLRQWLHNIGRKKFSPTANSRLCSAHFLPECFVQQTASASEKRRKASLQQNAVPTEFSHRSGVKLTEVSEERTKRRERRAKVTSESKKRKTETDTVQDIQEHESLKAAPPFTPSTSVSPGSTNIEKIVKKAPSYTVTRAMAEVEASRNIQVDVEMPLMPSPSTPPSEQTIAVRKTPSHTVTKAMAEMEASRDVQVDVEMPLMPPPSTPPTVQKPFVHSLFGTPCRTGKDHPYAKKKGFQSTGTQTSKEQTPVEELAERSSPLTSPFHEPELEPLSSDFDPLPGLSSSSDSPSSSEKEEQDSAALPKNKYIVFEEKLKELHKFCNRCGSPIVESSTFTKGSLVGFKNLCHSGHNYVWHSQPLVQKQPLGNLLITAAILISGGTYAKFSAFVSVANLLFFSKTVFNKLQKLFVLPVIQEYWEKERKHACEGLKSVESIVLAGDGRCDSPGHTAKYGSYALMHANGDGKAGSRKIVSLKLVQVSEVKNSNHMEPEGLTRCLKEVANEGLDVGVLATDRHIMISKLMRTGFKKINHQYDIWHLAKGVIKKLTAKSKTKDCADLAVWIQSISNHLWWSSATCGQDEQVLREKWMSILNHITNNHQWSGNQRFHHCEHPPLTTEDRKAIKWLKPESPSFKALKKVVTDPLLLKAMKQLTKFCHTGELEVFHSMLLKFCPKRQHFHYDAMTGRLMLAALEWNSSTRQQKVDEQGKPATSVEYSKRRKTFVLKNRYSKVKADYATELMNRIQEVHQENIALKPMEQPELQQTIAVVPKPAKEELQRKFRSRFT